MSLLMMFMLIFNLGMYPKTLVATEINITRDVVVCEDYNGNVWEFDGTEDWEVGDIVSAVMWNAGTEIIYDDEFIMCRYGGNVIAKGKEWQEDGTVYDDR